MSSSQKEKARTKEKIRPKSRMIKAKVRTIVTRKARMSTLKKMVTPRIALRYAGFANVSSLFMYTSNKKY